MGGNPMVTNQDYGVVA